MKENIPPIIFSFSFFNNKIEQNLFYQEKKYPVTFMPLSFMNIAEWFMWWKSAPNRINGFVAMILTLEILISRHFLKFSKKLSPHER